MRIFKHSGLLSFLITGTSLLLVSSCRKVDVDFGSQFLNNGNTQVVKSDTIKPVISTVFVDSFITSGTGVALLGSYTDPVFGKIVAQPYYELTSPTVDAPGNKAVLDSIVVMVVPNKSFYGDSVNPVKLTVYQLAENIVPNPSTNVFFDNDSIKLGAVLGQTTKVVRPRRADTLSIRLSNVLGDTLLNQLKNKDERVTNSDKFINYFKGLSIASDAGNTMAFGCSDAIIMRLYYHEPDITVNRKKIDFRLSTSNRQFNQIKTDRTGTILGNAGFGTTPAKRELNSALVGNAAYVQYSTGSMVKITFPSVRSLLQIPNFSKVLQAELIIKPAKASYLYPYSLPATLRLSMTDLNNQFMGDLTQQVGNSIVSQTGNLEINQLSPEKTGYSFDVTNYLNQTWLSSVGATAATQGFGLLLARPANAHITTFDRLVVAANPAQPGDQIQLVIYYLTVK